MSAATSGVPHTHVDRDEPVNSPQLVTGAARVALRRGIDKRRLGDAARTYSTNQSRRRPRCAAHRLTARDLEFFKIAESGARLSVRNDLLRPRLA
jgi:hypothetical protein